MSWIEQHPYKMAIVASVICSFFGMIIFSIISSNSLNANWNGFIIAQPFVWMSCFFFPGLSSVIEKVSERKK